MKQSTPRRKGPALIPQETLSKAVRKKLHLEKNLWTEPDQKLSICTYHKYLFFCDKNLNKIKIKWKIDLYSDGIKE